MDNSYLLTTKTVSGKKGRTFQGVVLAMAAGLSEASRWTSPLRPTLLMVACAPGESKAMLQNLREGREATLSGKGRADIELKGANYAFDMTTAGPAVVITALVPDLYDYQPGIADADELRFAVMPASVDVAAILADQDAEVTAALEHVSKVFTGQELGDLRLTPRLVGEAAMFAWYLGQRCEPPRFTDLAFSTQLFVAAQREPPVLLLPALPLDLGNDSSGNEAVKRIGFRSYVAPGVQMSRGFGFRATHAEVTTFMSAQVRIFDDMRRGKPSRRAATVAHARAALASLAMQAQARGAL